MNRDGTTGSIVPDFSTIALEPSIGEGTAVAGEPWMTPEEIAVRRIYGPADSDGLDFVGGYPGIAPYLRGPYPTMYVNQP
ncbi:MAG: hypothetical protein KDH19_15425, partial [Geminicoccaceae bacterium]|nr:hypothetical protein [Geminicoccaceae bacterium]